MSEPQEECDNCHKLFPESKIPTHFGYCRRNIKKCPGCGEMYDINFQEEHEEEFHKKLPCQFCRSEFAQAEHKKHENLCPKRTQFCEYCEQNVPISEFGSHLRACEARTKVCEKCRKPVANKDYLGHLVSCPGYIEPQKPKNNYELYAQQNREQLQRPREELQRAYIPKDATLEKNKAPYISKDYGLEEVRENKYKKEEKSTDLHYRQQEREKPMPVRPGQSNPIKAASRPMPNQERRQPEKQEREKISLGRNPGQIKPTQPASRAVQPPAPESRPSYNKAPEAYHPKNIPITVAEPKYQPSRAFQKQEDPKYPIKRDTFKNEREQMKQVPDKKIPVSTNSNKPTSQTRFPAPSFPAAYKPASNFPLNQEILDYNPRDFDSNEGEFTDAEMKEQQMIWESMKGQAKKPSKPQNSTPHYLRELEGADPNESFMLDADYEKQRRIMEEFEQKKNRRR